MILSIDKLPDIGNQPMTCKISANNPVPDLDVKMIEALPQDISGS